MPINIELKIQAYSTLYFKFWEGASVKSCKLQLTVFYFLFYIVLHFYISSYYFLQLFRTSFNIIWKRFLLQIFLFKQIHSDPLNGRNLLSVTKHFSQFSLKCLLKYFFQKFVDKILQKHLFCISSELLLYIYFKGSNYRFSGVFFLTAIWLFHGQL